MVCNRNLLFQVVIFRCHVSFREGTIVFFWYSRWQDLEQFLEGFGWPIGFISGIFTDILLLKNQRKNGVKIYNRPMDPMGILLGGSSHEVVSNHGDPFRPQFVGLWDPFHSWPFCRLINGPRHPNASSECVWMSLLTTWSARHQAPVSKMFIVIKTMERS